MTRRVFLSLAIAAAILSLVGAAETGVSLSGSIAVFDTATDSDYENLTSARFGPGKTSETIVVYLMGAETPDYTIVSRAINTTQVLAGNTTNAITTASTTISDITSGVVPGYGNGYIAFAWVEADSDSCNQVYLSLWDGVAGSSIFSKKAVTDNACVTCDDSPATDGQSWSVAVQDVVFNGDYVYVSWSAIEMTEDNTTCGTNVTGGITVSMQGYNATSTAEALWNSTLEILSADDTTDYSASLGLSCHPSNDAEVLWCEYSDIATEASHYYVTVNVTAGTKGTPITYATDTSDTADGVTTTTTYTHGGWLNAVVAQGIIINEHIAAVNDTNATDRTDSNTLNIYNLTTAATSGTAAATNAISGYSNDEQTGYTFGGYGVSYGDEGYLLLDWYNDGTDTNFGYTLFYSNGTANGTRVAIGTTESGGNPFLNADNALWMGVYSVNDTNGNTLMEGSVKQVLAETYSAGNALVTVFALFSVMIAALFAF